MYTTILNHVNQRIILTEKEQDYFKSVLFPVVIAKRKKLVKPSRLVKHEYFVIKGCLIGYYLDETGKKNIIQFAIENWRLQNETTARYLVFCKAYPNIEQRVANYHIANYLGVSAEALRRVRRKLIKKSE